jgi:hypothetical protein
MGLWFHWWILQKSLLFRPNKKCINSSFGYSISWWSSLLVKWQKKKIKTKNFNLTFFFFFLNRESFIPKEEIKQNENFILAITPRGSHIDFFTGYRAVRWVYWPCMEFLDYIDKKVDDRKMEFEDWVIDFKKKSLLKK